MLIKGAPGTNCSGWHWSVGWSWALYPVPCTRQSAWDEMHPMTAIKIFVLICQQLLTHSCGSCDGEIILNVTPLLFYDSLFGFSGRFVTISSTSHEGIYACNSLHSWSCFVVAIQWSIFPLTFGGWEKMGANLLRTFSNTFSWMKMSKFRIQHWFG